MEVVEIKERLQEAVDKESWDIIIELLGDIEMEIDYISPFNDYEDETDWDETLL
jgi:hypothetical protein